MSACPRPWLLALALAACGIQRDLDRGDEAIARRDLPRAEASFLHALEKDPDRVEALYGLGWTYLMAGQPDSARTWFERCQEVRPDSPLGYKGLGSVALAEENLVLAEQRFQEALARSPGDVAVENSLALVWMKGGHIERALTALEGLHDRHPENLSVAAGLAEALLRGDRREEALGVVDRALARSSGSEEEGPGRALLFHLRARILVGLTAGRVDPDRCPETLPPILTYLEQADAALADAEKTGFPVPELPSTRRLILRRRNVVTEACPLDHWNPEEEADR